MADDPAEAYTAGFDRDAPWNTCEALHARSGGACSCKLADLLLASFVRWQCRCCSPFFFQGLKPECAMGWGKRKEEVDGTLVREDFDFIWMYRRNGGRKLCERKGKRKEGGKGGRVAWKIILIREKLKRDYEVERRIGTGTSRLSRHVYHVVFLFLFKS